jgi:hypothetical protein
MYIFYFIFFIPITIIFLGIVCFGLIYFYMGALQLFNAQKKENNIPKTGGLLSIIISAGIIILSLYSYFKYIWIW